MVGNWKKDLNERLDANQDELIAINIKGDLYLKEKLPEAMARLDKDFDDGYGGSEGESFWAWGKKYLYFCGVYDGSEWISDIPIMPSEGNPSHIGGE